jgi:hypothetical protein
VIATVVDWDALLQVIWVSLVAGVGVTAAWAFAIVGGTRSLENGRDGRGGAAVVYAAIGVIGFAAVVAAIVFGIVILTDD